MSVLIITRQQNNNRATENKIISNKLKSIPNMLLYCTVISIKTIPKLELIYNRYIIKLITRTLSPRRI